MASKQTYECYRCRDAGYPNVRVYLDGKDANGKTIYKNEDMSPHQHRGQQLMQTREQKQPAQQQDKLDEILLGIKRILVILEKEQENK